MLGVKKSSVESMLNCCTVIRESAYLTAGREGCRFSFWKPSSSASLGLGNDRAGFQHRWEESMMSSKAIIKGYSHMPKSFKTIWRKKSIQIYLSTDKYHFNSSVKCTKSIITWFQVLDWMEMIFYNIKGFYLVINISYLFSSFFSSSFKKQQ